MELFFNEQIPAIISERRLILMSVNEDESRYVNASGNSYLVSRFWSEMLDKAVTIMERLPQIELEQLIKLITSALAVQDIAALSNLITERWEGHQKRYRLQLIEHLEFMLKAGADTAAKEKIRMCVYESNLFDPTNREPIVGKSYQEIQADAACYRKMAGVQIIVG
ncbi:MAG: hypothetical protein EOP49_34210 [Sphingobacteriales bacterium]|nr:MAG: hypothetical protein EOP49_34210 [Sphingobacteriales bacterium]